MNKIILMYHCVYCQDFKESGFQEGNSWQYKVSLEKFEEQVSSLSEYCKFQNVDKNKVELTFDDGGVSFWTVIAPVLEKYGFKGVFYISTKYINTPGFLTKENIKDLYRRGHIIGSHSHSHPSNLDKLDSGEMLNEWMKSKKILEEILQDRIEMASIPNGNGSRQVYDAAYKAGFKILDTSEPTTIIGEYKNMLVRGRFVVHNNMTTTDLMKIIKSKRQRKKLYYKRRFISIIKVVLGDKYDRIKRFFLRR